MDAEAGLWPLLGNRAAALLVLVPLFVRRPQRLRMPARMVWACSGAGVLGMSAITLYTLAPRKQSLSLTVVLTATYPAIPVLLGVTVLRERLTRPQVLGLAPGGRRHRADLPRLTPPDAS
ncbi:EamA family transporter [Streptomyces sp. RKND-216]|uniref:EamA family transporter n=1 Tax=Streptomyces sp. RKND-216 TaxID=2562581 RepID=UPI0032B46D2F